MYQKILPSRVLTDVLRKAAVGCGFLLLANMSFAQQDVPDLNGVWSFGRCSGGGGGMNLGCMLLGENDELLNSRAIAYRDVIDEHAQPKYDCAPMPIPHMWSDPYAYMIEQFDDHVKIHYGKDDVIRTVWLEGHGPDTPVNEFFYFGYSSGRFEDGALVVTTDRFTFDPQGLNADFRIPSSTQKQLIERFSRDGDNLTLEVTTVDPVFLNAPWSFTVTSRLEDYEWDGYWGCDLEATRKDLKLTPPKYPAAPIERIEYQQ